MTYSSKHIPPNEYFLPEVVLMTCFGNRQVKNADKISITCEKVLVITVIRNESIRKDLKLPQKIFLTINETVFYVMSILQFIKGSLMYNTIEKDL